MSLCQFCRSPISLEDVAVNLVFMVVVVGERGMDLTEGQVESLSDLTRREMMVVDPNGDIRHTNAMTGDVGLSVEYLGINSDVTSIKEFHGWCAFPR
jgi:hypothetical protein